MNHDPDASGAVDGPRVVIGDELGGALGFRVNRLARAMKQHWAASIADLELTTPQSAVLRGVAQNPGGALRAIARVLGSDPMSTKRCVDGLEARGLLESQCPSNDRRLRTLTLTDEGVRLATEVARRARLEQESYDSAWSVPEREGFVTAMARLEDALGLDHGASRGESRDGGVRVEDSASRADAARWDEHFASHGWSDVPDAELVALLAGERSGRALDLGCANGRNSLWLATTGWSVVGVDGSQVGLAQFRARAAAQGASVDLVCEDLADYVPAPASFDLVIVANVHVSPMVRDVLLSRAVRAVAPGGHLYLAGHHRDSLGVAGPPDPLWLYDERVVRDALSTLRLERIARIERVSEDGGSRPVVDVVAWATAVAPVDGARR